MRRGVLLILCSLWSVSGVAFGQMHFRPPHSTGENASVGIPATVRPVINDTPLTVGDEIAVFTPEGICAGAGVWNGAGLAITVWGDDALTEEVVEGMRNGEEMFFRVWEQSSNTEYSVVIVEYSQGDGSYRKDGLYILSSLRAIAPPNPPEPVSPTDGAKGVTVNPLFQWRNTAYADSFHLQVSPDGLFANLTVDQDHLTDTTSAVNGLSGMTTYYWRVRGANAAGPGSFSSVFRFTTTTAPPAIPVPSSPPDGAIDQSTTPLLSWNASPGAERYRIQISHDSTFASWVVDSILTATSLTAGPLQTETRYHWRVNASNSGGASGWSSTWRFTTHPATPEVPSLKNPPDGAANLPTTLTLEWTNAPKASSYDVQVSTDQSFASTVVDKSSMMDLSLEIGPLGHGRTYFWKVRARNAGGTSPWSNSRSFSTSPTIPSSPVLLAPSDGAQNLATTLRLHWGSVDAAISYRVEVSKTAGFTQVVFDSAAVADTSIVVGPLSPAGVFFWRVTGINAGGAGPPSSTRTFFTHDPSDESSYTIDLAFPRTANAEPKDYRLVGLPGSTTTPVHELLRGSQETDWRAYWDNGKSSDYLVEVTSRTPMSFGQGRGFWIIHDGPLVLEPLLSPYPMNSWGEAEVPLHRGWNIITNPFSVPVPWTIVQERNQLMEVLYSFQRGFFPADTMQPFMGYYVFNPSDNVLLRIPRSAQPNPSFAKSKSPIQTNWRVNVILRSGAYEDRALWFGVSSDAAVDYDAHDVRKPRGVGPLCSSFFSHPTWDQAYDRFASDVRPRIDSIQVWDIHISSSSIGACNLQFTGIERVPPGYEIRLIDKERKRTINLRDYPEYEFVARPGEFTLQIAVGDRDAVHAIASSAASSIDLNLLPNYPNPFNASTLITFVLPAAMEVSLTVYNIVGQHITTIHQGFLTDGSHSFLWNGTDASGSVVSSGIYVCRLAAGGKELARTMLLLK